MKRITNYLGRPSIMALVIALCVSYSCTPSHPQQTGHKALGINTNERLAEVKQEDMERTKTIWARGFLQFFDMYPNVEALDSDSNVVGLLELKENGYKTILNIKFQFRPREVPKTGSEEMKAQKEFLIALLDRIWDATDIFVVGNEPFVDSRPEQQNEDLLAYHKGMARVVKEYKKSKNSDTPIYVGAFTRLYEEEMHTDVLKGFLDFIRQEDWIAGADIHIHHRDSTEMRASLDYITERLRDDQGLLITEFSLIWHWKDHVRDTLAAEFAKKYGYDTDMQVYEYIEKCLRNPVKRQEWVDFLSSSTWFESRKNYLKESYEMFREYPHFDVATYAYQTGFNFQRQTFTERSNPWLLNSLFVVHTVEKDPVTGLYQFNYNWMDEFQEIQKLTAKKNS